MSLKKIQLSENLKKKAFQFAVGADRIYIHERPICQQKWLDNYLIWI